jgi:hypothetical protein
MTACQGNRKGRIREQEGVADNGVVAVLSTLEMGMS